MRWRKHGVVWAPHGDLPWARTHATCPTPIVLDNGTLRVYIQCRDHDNVGRVGFVDLDPADPRRVIDAGKSPVLDIGAPGSFDDSGVFQCSVVRLPNGSLYLYYVGFELCRQIRYRLLTGVAISTDGGASFQRAQSVPVLERSDAEPLFRCGPFVIREDELFRMWYVAGGSWVDLDGQSLPVYDLRYMESVDGLAWPLKGEQVMPIDAKLEHGHGRPYVLREANGAYRMHYSVRRRSPAQYRMGFARSADGLHWHRDDDNIGIDVSESPWETESVEFGAEFVAAGKTWLLYNGNDFGRAGFCIAERLDG